MKKFNIILKMRKEFGLFDGMRLLYWIIAYRTFLPTVVHGGVRRIFSHTLKRYIYIRPNSTDILLLITFFCKYCDDHGGMEYKIDFSNKVKKIEYIIDAGANIGLFTLIYSVKYPNAKIIAIEPESENYELLLRNTEDIENVVCLKGGVWNKDTTINILETYDKKEWGFIVQECTIPNGNEIKGISIATIIKRFKIPHIDILKMDIEGSEYEVFSENYKEWLQVTQSLIIEMHEWIKPGCEKIISDVMELEGFEFEKNGENRVYYRKR